MSYLIYDGEYLNGKRSKGKEYNEFNTLIYDGEYLNGKKLEKNSNKLGREATGIFYQFRNKLNNEERTETGEIIRKQYNYYTGELIFGGTLFNGKKWNGKGKEYYYDNTGNRIDTKGILIFEGEYLYGFRKKGREYLHGRLEYEGDYLFHKNIMGKDMIGKEMSYMN